MQLNLNCRVTGNTEVEVGFWEVRNSSQGLLISAG